MNMLNSKIMSTTTAIVGVALLLCPVSSIAKAGQKSGVLYSDWSGNYFDKGNSDAKSKIYTRSYSRSTFDANKDTSRQEAKSEFDVTVGIFKTEQKVLDSTSVANAYRRAGGKDGYSSANIKVNGQTVANASYYQKDRWSKSVVTWTQERQYFFGRHTYPAGGFNLTLTGKVSGLLNVEAIGHQKFSSSNSKYFQDKGQADIKAVARLYNRLSVNGIPYNEKTNFELVDVSNATKSSTRRRHHYERAKRSQRQYSGKTWSRHSIDLDGGAIHAFTRTIANWSSYLVEGRVWINKSYEEFFSS